MTSYFWLLLVILFILIGLSAVATGAALISVKVATFFVGLSLGFEFGRNFPSL